ncbi:hypothetical protein [Hyalangium sp.]|uniref:hypothetical protein n=1 Tax=Hyalangium sp. TaxID=2028555 RepID=UPI002D6F9AE2|nr:hypothetical protein [Hyalangium sp.]HYH96248.1 hypothetical protein [Hyalangium sp.]
MDLIVGQIERVEGLVDFERVPVMTASEPTYAMDSSGRKWIRKSVLHTVHEPLLAEALGWLLARALGVRTPDGAIGGEGDGLSWLSLRVDGVTHWHPSSIHFIKNAKELGRMLVLDVVILNEDRHEGNILLQPNPDQYNLVAWAIDTGGALIGFPESFAQAGMALPSIAKLARGIPVELVADEARATALQATTFSPYLLRRFVEEACQIAGEPKDGILLEALSARMKGAPDLTEKYLQSIEQRP